MEDNQKQQVTDIVNAFRVLNKDIRESFKDMSEALEVKSGFEKLKKQNTGEKILDEGFFTGLDDWYSLNCYGIYNKKVVGFTFVIGVNYDENENTDYSDFIDQLDKNINKNTPMLCIFGAYEPIKKDDIRLTDDNNWQYVDTILKFTDDWKNYEIEKIKYNEWIDVEVDYLDGKKIKEGYDGWFNRAKVKIRHITDIVSKEEAKKIIDDLV